MVAQASRVLGFTPAVRLEGPVESVLSDEVRTEMVASMREALGNVARHARPRRRRCVVEIVDDQVVMTVVDNGVGPPDGRGQRARRPRTQQPDVARRSASAARARLTPRDPAEGTGAVLRWTARF